MNKDITKKDADLLYSNNLLSYPDYLKAVNPSVKWPGWMQTQAFLFGTVLILAGIVCFFAYNWENMGKFIKLALPLLGFVILGLAAAATGLEKLSSKVLSTSAAFMIGVFCAVYGQVYQTGADAWQLFFTWSLCMLPLAFITSFAGLWLLFVVVFNVFLFTYPFYDRFDDSLFFLYPIIFNLCFLLAAEFSRYKNYVLKESYFRNLLFIYVLGLLFVPSFIDIIMDVKYTTYFPAYLVFTIAGVIYFLKTKQAITLIGTTALTWATMIMLMISLHLDLHEPLFYSFIILALFAATGFATYKAYLYIKEDK